MKHKCVVLLSGGLDSSVLLYSLVADYECYPVSFNYGQRHSKEVMYAIEVCNARNQGLVERFKVVDLCSVGKILPSVLTSGGDIPAGHYEDESMKQTVVPNRNMIMLAIAAGYAQGIGAEAVAIAAHAGDHAIYPDCRKEFMDALSVAIQLGTGWNNDGIKLLSPFVGMSKADIVSLGAKLNVPFSKTWSCYSGGSVHCGVCGTCVERREAFALAGVKDPTVYLAEILKDEGAK